MYVTFVENVILF